MRHKLASPSFECIELIRIRLGDDYDVEEIQVEDCTTFLRGVRIRSLQGEDLVDIIAFRNQICSVSSGEVMDEISVRNGYSFAYAKVLKILRNKGFILKNCA